MQDLDKVKIRETLIAASKPRPYTLVEQQKVGHDHDETTIYNYEIRGSASTIKEVATGEIDALPFSDFHASSVLFLYGSYYIYIYYMYICIAYRMIRKPLYIQLFSVSL